MSAAQVFGLLGGLLAPVCGAVAISRIRKRRQRGLVLVVCGAGGPAGERLPEGVAHGLDLAVGDCFWAPAASGEADVFRRPCAAGHTGEAFEVLPLGEGPMPDILELYRNTLARCEAGAGSIPGVRVQVMTPTSASWAGGKHRAVCYYHFAAEKTGPVR
ncbi:septum formation family protein [Amycolatopsis sp. MtRt-6]|uniref:septum formation family protein n=1 Tax=Amycolatopsis sp. MtRt-6 TaxID=2792782 RepID=UPI001F5D9EF4|nr:septum formation family protein [Amycolatopsis sp. MtRt-6]